MAVIKIKNLNAFISIVVTMSLYVLQKLKWCLLLCSLYQKHQIYIYIQWKDQLFECIWVCISVGSATCVFKEFTLVIPWSSGISKCWSMHQLSNRCFKTKFGKIIFLYTFPPFCIFERTFSHSILPSKV